MLNEVRDAMRRQGQRQQDVARAIGASQGAVAQFLNEYDKPLGLEKRLKLERHLSLPYGTCLTNDELDLTLHPNSRFRWQYLYVMALKCNDHLLTLYGATENLGRRVAQHSDQLKIYRPNLKYSVKLAQKGHAASIENKVRYHFAHHSHKNMVSIPPGMSTEILPVQPREVLNCIESHLIDCAFELCDHETRDETPLLPPPAH